MTKSLKKRLDNTPDKVYNLLRDGEGRFILPDPLGRIKQNRSYELALLGTSELALLRTSMLTEVYEEFRRAWDSDPSLFPNPPIFAGGFFRDIIWGEWSNDLDVFFNSHGMTNEEAEDSLALFMAKIPRKFTEKDNRTYVQQRGSDAGLPGVFRVFDEVNWVENFCPVQIILKDMGPPEDNPLYAVRDFNYNHAMIAMPVTGEPAIHCAGPAVFGWENSCHVQFKKKGLEKCNEVFHRKTFNILDLMNPNHDLPDDLLERKKEAIKRRNEKIARFGKLYGNAPAPMFPLPFVGRG